MYYKSGVITNLDNILIYDINAPRVKHPALTKVLRHKWERNPNVLRRIVYNCDVSPYLGALPPELRAQLPGAKIAETTALFRDGLENFLIQNAPQMRVAKADVVYNIPEIGDLFGTQCQLHTRGITECNPWVGISGFVSKLSFPDINAHYALKLFHHYADQWLHFSHGPWFEVATALAAGRAEPRDNNTVYMASLMYEQYMLSAWGGDKDDEIRQRENRYIVFVARDDENKSRNLRGGRRIDWGETYRTDYGSMSYRARKLFRQVACMDAAAVQRARANAKNARDKAEAERAIELVGLVAWYDDNERLLNFVNSLNQR